MAYDKCVDAVVKAIGRDIAEKEKKQIGRTVEDLIDRYTKSESADGLTERVMKAVDELIQDTEAALVIEKRNAALNAAKRIEGRTYLKEVWSDNPEEGLKALLGNTSVDRRGARQGVSGQIDSLAHNYVSGMTSRLMKDGTFDLAASGKFDEQIWLAMAELGKKVPDEGAMGKMNPEVVKIAKVFNDYNELARSNANRSGAWIGKLEGYVLRRTHDTAKIQRAAGMGIPANDPRHKTAWKQWVSENLDWEKTMSDVPMDERDKVLSKLYEQFSNGVHVKFGEGGVTGLKGFQNVGKRLSRERILHFKTPKAEYDYHVKFGAGSNLFDGITHGLMRVARDTAIMRKLGPNAKANLDSMVSDLKQSYVAQDRGDLAKRLEDAYKTQERQLWPTITGEINIPERAMIAKWSKTVRDIEVMGSLGKAVLSGTSDIPFYASTMRYTGDRSLGSFFEGMNDAIRNIVGGVGKKYTPDEIQTASEMGILLDAVSNPATHFTADVDMPGRTSAWVQKYFKWNGLSWWQDKFRMGAVMATGNRHAKFSNLSYDSLPSGIQATLRQFDISSAEWDLIRSMEQHTDSRGRSFLTPEGISDIPGEKFAALAKDGEALTPAKLSRLRENLQVKYRTLFSEVAAMATSEPGKMERAIMMQGTKPGTLDGELWRHFWMFKSFTVSVMRKHLGREFFGYNANVMSLPQAMQAMLTGKNKSGMEGMANLIVFGTMAGYASMALKDLTAGKTPRFPSDAGSAAKIFAAAMAQSGAMGIYGDFLFGEAKSRFGHGPLETFLGPTWGRASDLFNLYTSFRDGDKTAAKAFHFMMNNTPIVNAAYSLFYTRLALDYLLIYRIQEMMNPGYLRRMQDRMKSEKQQEFLVPPTKVVPYGGF